ncbi:hypothetical protein P9G72_01395 [Bacillus velezensis]|uniref:hypothetical protein n=1 Tax=Bacillus velezensis TaxID=492670 RepID=UPI0011A63DCA|nr:hypothetical protein [Bacillus velezensis]MEC2237843.1 hypothetical protein [Bacillus velezensis]
MYACPLATAKTWTVLMLPNVVYLIALGFVSGLKEMWLPALAKVLTSPTFKVIRVSVGSHMFLFTLVVGPAADAEELKKGAKTNETIASDNKAFLASFKVKPPFVFYRIKITLNGNVTMEKLLNIL